MIDDKRKLRLLISCNTNNIATSEQKNNLDRFVDGLTEEEVKFCLARMKG